MRTFVMGLAMFAVLGPVGYSISFSTPPPPPNVILLTKNNHVAITDQITMGSIQEAMKKFSKLLAKRKNPSEPIYLVLDTPGGSVDAGFRLYEFLRTYPQIKTVTINSMSMGALLVELLPGERLILETGTLMFHRMKANLAGDADHMQALLDWMRKSEEFAEARVSARSGISREELRKKLDAEWYVDSSEAVQRKLVDRVVVLRCSKDLLESSTKKEVSVMPFLPPVEVEISDCPLKY